MSLIYIIGLPGVGKTQFGKKLARAMDFQFCDLDAEIEKKEGTQIVTLFKKYPESYFRKTENKTLLETLNRTQTVVSTGGGTPQFYNNMELMLEHGTVLYLTAEPAQIIKRIQQNKTTRPLFSALSNREIEQKVYFLLEKRAPFYEQAHLYLHGKSIAINNKSIDNQRVTIITQIQKHIVNF